MVPRPFRRREAPERRGPLERITRFLIGPLLVLGGSWFIFLPFGFASMKFGDADPPPGWAESPGQVLKGGASSIAIGFTLAVGGLWPASGRAMPSEAS